MTLQMLPTPTLRYLAIELTNSCNLKCSVCWSQNPHLYPPRPKGFMTDALYHKILAELEQQWHPKEINIALSYAGESLLHPHFTRYLRELADLHPKRLQLATNGTKLTKTVMNALVDVNTEVAVSLHKTRFLSLAMRRAKELWRMKTEGQTVRVNIVNEEFSQNEIDHVTATMHRETDQIKLITYITEDMQTAMPHTTFYPLCPSMYTYLAIQWDGNCLPCCHILSHNNFTLGNINDQTIKQVWKSKQYEALRLGATDGTPCMNCQVKR